MLQKRKLPKRLSGLIIPIAVAAVILSAILITNIFIPIKYLSAYINLSTDKPREGEMRISFIDVGEGDCTLIEFPDGKVALFDGGSGSFDKQLKIFKKLNSSEINKIDYLFCTSSAAKRCGGLAEIVKYKEIGKVYAPICKNIGATYGYRNFVKQVRNKNKELNECVYGAGCYSEEYGYCVWVLYPPKSVSDGDSVCASAIWISYGGTNVLMLGDLSSAEMFGFLNAYTVGGFEIDGHSIILEDCNVVKVPSGIEAGGALIELCDLIQPETAILSTDDATFSLIADVGNFTSDDIYRTGINGTVTLSISVGNYEVKKER
ncbi:MAG: hypothetical protein J1G05_01145 [Clostridiales bacterium]|nr:hypothetical protein [Clostridiales bacterium]